MAGLEDLFPGLSALTSDAFNAVRKRSAKLNLILQDAQNNERAHAQAKPPVALPRAAQVSPKTGKGRSRSKNRDGGEIAFEDEARNRRPGRRVTGRDAGMAAGSRARPSAPIAAALRSAAPKPHASNVAAARPTSLAVPRTSAAVKSGLASGSQSAVVKLASFASGGSRVGALMTYQSHGGEIALEMSDGSRVDGVERIKALADEWASDAPSREVSKDVMMFSITVAPGESDERIRGVLSESLVGHKYAWRAEHTGTETRIEVVATAASSRRDEKGKAFRVYDNEKSLSAFAERVAGALGEDAHFEERGFSHGVDGAARYLSRLTRGGAQAAELVGRRQIAGREANLSVAKSWKRDLRSREQRDVAHVILSAKPGTDKEAFVAAARATLEREFEAHDFAFALHENRAHLHVHAVVKMQSRDGGRMHPRIQDFARWRATLAEEARERNIPMEAASRFEQANPPGYKLKDIRRVERGQASESVRRRVEAVRTSVVHVPSRPEGREKARAIAGQWQAFAPTAPAEPPIAQGAVRLYRADRPGAAQTSAPLFARDRAAAETMAARSGGSVSYVDIPIERLGELKPARSAPGSVFVVPVVLADQRKPLVANVMAAAEPMSRVLELRSRTETAARASDLQAPSDDYSSYKLLNYSNSARIESKPPANPAVTPRPKGSPDMPDFETMQEASPDLFKHLNALADNAPEEHREEVRRHRDKIAENYDRAARAQAKQERNVGIEGDTYVEPKPRKYDNFTAYVPEQRGEAIRYAHKYDDGSAGKIAFVDTGKRVEVNDWKDKEATLAAMQLATEKWDELTVKGPEKYKAMVISLAAEHGYKIANPELQDRFEAEKARIAADRQSRPGFEGPAQAQRPEPAPFETYPGMGVAGAVAVKPADPERDAKYAEAYRDMTAHKSAAVDNLVTVLRETRYTEGQPGSPYSKREDAEVAIAMARREAIQSLPSQDQLRFAAASATFISYNNKIDGTELLAAERRGVDKEQAAPAAPAQTPGAPAKLDSAIREPNNAQKQGTQPTTGIAGPVRTDAERDAELARIQRRTDEEAHRETRQATVTSALHEKPGDTDYRSQGEAASARAADQAVETNRTKDIPVTLETSPEIHRLANEQARVKAESRTADQLNQQQPPKDRPRGQRQ